MLFFSSAISDRDTSSQSWSVKMNLKLLVVLSLFSLIYAETDTSSRESRYINYKKKYYGELYKKTDASKPEVQEGKKSEEYANDALNGMYSDCFTHISFSCLQKKVLNFINRMNRMEKFSVFGNYVSVVRTKDEYEQESEFQARLDTAEQESTLDQLMETAIDRWVLRISWTDKGACWVCVV